MRHCGLEVDDVDVEQQLQLVDLTAAVLKAFGAKWMVEMHQYIQDIAMLI